MVFTVYVKQTRWSTSQTKLTNYNKLSSKWLVLCSKNEEKITTTMNMTYRERDIRIISRRGGKKIELSLHRKSMQWKASGTENNNKAREEKKKESETRKCLICHKLNRNIPLSCNCLLSFSFALSLFLFLFRNSFSALDMKKKLYMRNQALFTSVLLIINLIFYK